MGISQQFPLGVIPQSQLSPTDKPKRKRKAHSKVRTGCLTCKIRRKKCDELRPHCTQCTKTGRKCDGYAQSPPSVYLQYTKDSVGAQSSPNPNEIDVQVNKLDIDSNSNISAFGSGTPIDQKCDSTTHSHGTAAVTSLDRSIRVSHKRRRSNRGSALDSAALSIPQGLNSFVLGSDINDVDIHCFMFFCHCTGPQLSCYFDCNIFGKYTISRALMSPVLFSVAAALGAVHRRYNYGISREAFEYCGYAKSLQVRALRQLRHLKDKLSQQQSLSTISPGSDTSSWDRDIIVVSEIMMGVFAAFQAEHMNVVSHTTSALKTLLGRRLALSHTDSKFYPYLPGPEAIHQLLHRISTRVVQLFGSPANILASWGGNKQLPPIPSTFASIHEARDFIFTEVQWIFNVPKALWTDETWRTEMQDFHASRILQWNIAYAETMRGLQRTTQEQHACILLKLIRSFANILLYQTKSASSDEAYEELSWNLIRDDILAGIMTINSRLWEYDEDAIGFDSCIGPPRNVSPSIEASRKIRHLVKSMIKPKPIDKSQLEVHGVYNIAELICAVEEHSVVEATKDIMSSMEMKPIWVDVTCLMESRKVLLRYCTPHRSGSGLVWTSEWWAFE